MAIFGWKCARNYKSDQQLKQQTVMNHMKI